MPKLLVQPNAIVPDLELPGELFWTASSFAAFCRLNPEVEAELDAQGNILIASSTNSDADRRNLEFTRQLANWAHEQSETIVFGPSAGFTLPSGSVRSPDACAILSSDWDALTDDEQKSFAPVVPVFVMELRSSDDDPLSTLQEKMVMFLAAGVQLGWLVDPVTSDLTIYRPDLEPETIHAPKRAKAGNELPGLEIDFAQIW